MANEITIAIIGMGIVTYLLRVLPLVGLASLRLPRLLERWLRYVPVSVFAGLLFPSLLLREGRLDLGSSNPQILASLISLAVIVRTRNLALTVLSGVLAFLFLTLF